MFQTFNLFSKRMLEREREKKLVEIDTEVQ